MILGSSDFTGNFIIVDGATAPLVSIAAGADYMALSMDKAADQVQDLNKAVLTLANALPIVTGNLALFSGAAALAKREVKSLNAELAKTIGIMTGLNVVFSSGIPLTGGRTTARTGTGRRGLRPAWDVDVGIGGLLQRGRDATFRGSEKVIGAPRFSRTGALGYYREPQIIRSLGTGKIGALLNHPESETSRSIARKIAQGTSFAEAEKLIRRGYTDDWLEKHRLNELLSKPVKRLLPVKTPLKRDVLSSPKTPFYVKEAIENAVFREGKENVPDAGSVFRDVQKYFNSVGAGSITAPDEDIIQRRYARDGAMMKRISSVVNEFTGKKGAYSSYNPHLNQRLFKAFTEGEEGMKLSKLERNMLETLRGDKTLLRKFSGPAQGISWRIGEDRGFRMNDLAIMSRIPTSEMTQKSEMLKPGEFDDWITKEYVNRNLLGLKKAQVMKTTWRTGEREPIYPVRNWQKEVIKSLNKGQLTELTNIRKGQWTEDALVKESFRRLRKGIPLHFDTLFDKNPDLIPKADLLPGRIAPFASEAGMNAGLRRALRSTPYQTTLRDIAARQALPKTVSHWRANIMENAVKSLLADFEEHGVFPSDLEIKKRHDRSFMREKIQKGFVRTQFWDALSSPLLSESFTGRKLEEPLSLRANQAKFLEYDKNQRAWASHLGRLRAGRGIKSREQLNLEWEAYERKQAPVRAWAARKEAEQRLKDSFKIMPARGDMYDKLKPSVAGINRKHAPGAIRLRAFEEAFGDLGFGYGESSLAARSVENKFRGMGNKAVPANKATRAFSDTLKKMGMNTHAAAQGTHFLEQQIKRLDDPLKSAAFGSSLLNTRLGRLGAGFSNAGRKARGFGIISALALNEPMLAMVAMLGMMPPLIGGFAALGAAALGLGGAFAFLGLAGAMAWGDKLKNNTGRVSDLNKELGITGTNAAGSMGKMSYSVKGLTSDIGGLALVVNEFKKELGPIFTEFGKPWVPFMETLPSSIAGAFRKIFTTITPFSEMIQHDARAVGGWFTNIISGFLKYSLGLLRNPEIRSSFRTIMDAIPKYGKKGMDFIVNAFLENKETIKAFLKSMIELLPPFLTATTSFFRTIVPIITFVVKQFKNLVTLLGGGDAKRGANFLGLVAGGLVFTGLLSKTIGLAGTLVGKFIKLKEILLLIRAGQGASLISGLATGGGILGGAGKGVPGSSGPIILPGGAGRPRVTPTGGKVPASSPSGKLPTILAGRGRILTRALPAAAFITIAAGMGYVAYDAYSNHKKWQDEYNTNPDFRAGVDQAKWSEHLAESELRLNPILARKPDMSNLINAYNPSKNQAVNDLQEATRRADINVNINADPMFVAKVNQAMSKDTKVTAWVNYRT